MSDGGQSLKPERFAELVRQVRVIAEAIGRCVDPNHYHALNPKFAESLNL